MSAITSNSLLEELVIMLGTAGLATHRPGRNEFPRHSDPLFLPRPIRAAKGVSLNECPVCRQPLAGEPPIYVCEHCLVPLFVSPRKTCLEPAFCEFLFGIPWAVEVEPKRTRCAHFGGDHEYSDGSYPERIFGAGARFNGLLRWTPNTLAKAITDASCVFCVARSKRTFKEYESADAPEDAPREYGTPLPRTFSDEDFYDGQQWLNSLAPHLREIIVASWKEQARAVWPPQGIDSAKWLRLEPSGDLYISRRAKYLRPTKDGWIWKQPNPSRRVTAAATCVRQTRSLRNIEDEFLNLDLSELPNSKKPGLDYSDPSNPVPFPAPVREAGWRTISTSIDWVKAKKKAPRLNASVASDPALWLIPFSVDRPSAEQRAEWNTKLRAARDEDWQMFQAQRLAEFQSWLGEANTYDKGSGFGHWKFVLECWADRAGRRPKDCVEEAKREGVAVDVYLSRGALSAKPQVAEELDGCKFVPSSGPSLLEWDKKHATHDEDGFSENYDLGIYADSTPGSAIRQTTESSGTTPASIADYWKASGMSREQLLAHPKFAKDAELFAAQTENRVLENVAARIGVSADALRQRKNRPRRPRTTCLHGHLWTEENTYWTRTKVRRCRTCDRLQAAARRRNKTSRFAYKVEGETTRPLAA